METVIIIITIINVIIIGNNLYCVYYKNARALQLYTVYAEVRT